MKAARRGPGAAGLIACLTAGLGTYLLTGAAARAAGGVNPPAPTAHRAASGAEGSRAAADRAATASPPPPAASTATPTERAEPAPAPPTARAAPAPDLDKLRAEYDRLREELFKARVRSQKASETVFPSKLDVHLRWKGGPDFVIRKARMSLDGAELWDSADRPQTDDVIDVSARSVKPGPHAFTVRLEVRPKTEAKGGAKTGADKLGYTSEHTFAIVVPEGGLTHLALTGDEDGDPPEYEPELELEIETDK